MTDNEKNTCYTDFASMNSDSYIERALQGNWQVDINSRSGEEELIPTNRAVGLKALTFKKAVSNGCIPYIKRKKRHRCLEVLSLIGTVCFAKFGCVMFSSA